MKTMERLNGFRIVLFLLGLALVFVAERYAYSYDFYKYVVFIGLTVSLIPLLVTLFALRKSRSQKLNGESESWLLVLSWQILVLLGIACYYLYRWRAGAPDEPPSLLAQLLLVVYLSALILGAFVGLGVEQSHSYSGEGKHADSQRVRYSAEIWLSLGILLLGLIALNYGAAKKDKVFDLSYFKATRPGESTLKLVDTLTVPIKIDLFFAKDSEVLPFVREYAAAVAKRSSNLQLRVYDKDFFPLQAEESRVARNGQIVLAREGRRQKIDLGDKLENARSKLKTLDSQIQKALLQLSSDEGIIYFTASHGEMSWSVDQNAPLRSLRNLEALLRTQNLKPQVLPNTFTSIPEDAAAVAVVGPVSGFSKEEVATLRDYLNTGGKLLIALDVESGGEQAESIPVADQKELASLLSELGIHFRNEPLANDREYVRSTRQKFDHYYLYTNSFSAHESVTTLTRNDEKLNVLALQAGYLIVENAINNWQPIATIRTSRSTFVDKNKNLEFDAGEIRSAYTLTAVTEKNLANGKKARTMIFADASMLADPPLLYNGNQGMALDSFRWLTDRMDSAGATESEEDIKIQHAKGRELLVFHGSIYLVPALILGAGFIANRRKRQRA